jgi:hypothetical protein
MHYVDVQKWRAMPEAERAGQPIPSLESKKFATSHAPDVPDDALQDGVVAGLAVLALRELRDQPVFLAVGFREPHLPFLARRWRLDLYQPEEIPDAPRSAATRGAPALALHDWRELRGHSDMPKQCPLPPGRARELIHGYYLGRIQHGRAGRQSARRTGAARFGGQHHIVLRGDNGWHLGEHDLWDIEFDYVLSGVRHPSLGVATALRADRPSQAHAGAMGANRRRNSRKAARFQRRAGSDRSGAKLQPSNCAGACRPHSVGQTSTASTGPVAWAPRALTLAPATISGTRASNSKLAVLRSTYTDLLGRRSSPSRSTPAIACRTPSATANGMSTAALDGSARDFSRAGSG